MGDIGSAIKYLYSQFILRDVLSFIMPGAIVVLTAFLLFLPETCLTQRLGTLFRFSRDMHWLLYIPLFGVFYVVGFALQCLGELFGFVRFSPYAEKNRSKRWNMFRPSWDKNYDKPKKSNMWWWDEHKKHADFFHAIKGDTKDNADLRQGHERLVVMKQMCANGFLAIVIAGFLLAISYIPLLWVKLLLSITLVVVPLLASLFWGHRVYVLRQYTRERITVDRKKGRDTKNSKES